MVMLHFLRMMADLGFYYAFAGTVAGSFGGSLAFAGLLMQSACYALSASLRRRRWARLAALVPAVAFFLLPSCPADWIGYLPTLGYLVYLAWHNSYALSWERQADVFSLFYKAFPAFAVFYALVGGGGSVLSAGLPIALATAVASVLLMRSLRHGPEVYLQRAYQIRNVAAVACLLAAAGLVSMKWFRSGVAWLLGTVHRRVLAPLLQVAFMLVGYLALGIVTVLRWLQSLIHQDQGPAEVQTVMDSAEEQLQELVPWEGSGLARRFFLALGILAIAAVLLFFFRWLARRKAGEGPLATDTETRMDAAGEAKPASRRRIPESSYAQRIRSQYRSFLRLCQRHGIELRDADTSMEVGAKAARQTKASENLEAFRQIYEKARYRNDAARGDYLRSKKLLAEIRQSFREKE